MRSMIPSSRERGDKPYAETAVALRPGVWRPEWSVVTLPAARAALGRRIAAHPELIEKWSRRLDDSEDLVWRRVLELFAAYGRPPRIAEIASAVNMTEERLVPVLRQLRRRDLLACDEAAGAIAYAYPFTGGGTEHCVRLGEYGLHVLCAVDALGVGALYRQDVRVESSCRFCGADVRITTRRRGTALGGIAPDSTVIWYDTTYADGCAATSCCPYIAFFCSDEHLRRWRLSQAGNRQGCRLSPREGLQIGRALFGPVLTTPDTDRRSPPKDKTKPRPRGELSRQEPS
jgi:alkylmercury lyase